MFSRDGGLAIKPGFANILKLCQALNNPHQKLKFVHVAGTNGKGSVSHMLAAVLQTAGYKTGLYTSPHLKDFRERIKINGAMISEDEVIAFVENVRPLLEEMQPSFFEITVAMAFDHFASNQVEIAVIETGMGGRLDSTNIITPLLSVITNIGFDHMQFLGDTLEQIAFEKAGIIKAGIPVVIGEQQPETETVFRKVANEKSAPLYFAHDNFQIADWQNEQDHLAINIAETGTTDQVRYQIDLTGQYQTKNLLTVLEGCRQLNSAGLHIAPEQLQEGVRHTKKLTGLHGRWETIQQHPRVVLDVAHNESGIRELLSQLEITTYHRLHLILGMVKDKDVNAVLQMLPPQAIYYFTQAQISRALHGEALKEQAAVFGLRGKVYENVNKALAEAKAHAHADDLIVICGSVFLVGEVIV